MDTDEKNGEEQSRVKAGRSRPRLADALAGYDFSSMPVVDVYGSKFKERAEAMEKIDKEVAKGLYDWNPKRAHEQEATATTEENSLSRKTATTSAITEKEIIVEDPPPPPKSAKPMPKSKETKQIIKQIDAIKAYALSGTGPMQEISEGILDDREGILTDDVTCIDQEQEFEFNRNITVRVADYRSNIKKYTMLKRDSFAKIFNDLAREHNIEQDQVMLTFNEIFIKPYDTPTSIGFRIGDFIEFCKLNKPVNAPLTEMDKANRVTLKVQSGSSKKRIEISINKVDPLSRLMEEYCKQSGLDLTKLSFKFDDEDIDPESTPNDLELEDGYCIDAIEH